MVLRRSFIQFWQVQRRNADRLAVFNVTFIFLWNQDFRWHSLIQKISFFRTINYWSCYKQNRKQHCNFPWLSLLIYRSLWRLSQNLAFELYLHFFNVTLIKGKLIWAPFTQLLFWCWLCLGYYHSFLMNWIWGQK